MGVDDGNLQIDVDVIILESSPIPIVRILLVYTTIQYNTVQYHSNNSI